MTHQDNYTLSKNFIDELIDVVMSGARDAIAQAGILENTSVSVLAPGGSAGSILKIQVSGHVPNFMAPLTSLFPGLPGETFTVRADATFRQEGW